MNGDTYAVARLLGGPFTYREALAAGIGRGELSGKRFVRPFRGVYLSSDIEVSHNVLVAAALKVLPAATVVGEITGLWSHGIQVGSPHPLTFYTTHRHEIDRPGIVVHRVSHLPPHRGKLASPAHCWLSASPYLGLVDSVVAGDWLIHRGLATATGLMTFSEAVQNPLAVTRTALGLVRHGAESPRETRLRLMMVLAGLPEPVCNLPVRVGGRFVGRGDLVLEQFRMIVEYDGRQHLTSTSQWERDVVRLEAFADAGWHVTRVTNARMANARDLVRGIHTTMSKRGYRGPEPRFDRRWCSLFSEGLA